jgi:hypothetical protein
MRTAAHQVLRRHVLEQESTGAGRERGVDVLVQVEGGEDDDPRRRGGPGEDAAGGLQTVDLRHAHVHEHDVGTGPPDRVDRLRAGRGLGHHVHPTGGEDHAEPGADQRLIVGDHHPYRHVASHGIMAST